jgi:hypothetical protein
MARAAGFETMITKGKIHGFDRFGDYTEELKAFEALVRADEREQARSVPAQEPIYQMQMMDGKWIDQAKKSYEYNKAHGHTVRIVYTTPPAAPVPLTDEDRAILEAVKREMDDDGNAPGHRHQITGVWDDDNGELAGKPCAWCMTWKKFTTLIERETAHGITEKGQP